MKYFLLILLSVFITKGFSQVWIDSAAKWTFDYWNIGEGGTWRWEYTNDTVLQGKQTQIIESTKYQFSNDQFGNVISFSSAEASAYTYSSNDSVFYWNNNQFFLLYDFGASIGDTWTISIDTLDAACGDTAIVEVIDTGSVIINGINLRTITLQTISNSLVAMDGIAIERFGNFSTSNTSRVGFLPGYRYCPNGFIIEYAFFTFRCFEDNTFSTYNPTNKDCDTLTSIKEFKANDFQVFPNPAKDIVTIQSNYYDILFVEVIDIHGKQIIKIEGQENLNVSYLDSGYYLLRVTTTANDKLIIPFIKKQ